MLWFLLGLVAGGVLGMITLALMTAAKENEATVKYEYGSNPSPQSPPPGPPGSSIGEQQEQYGTRIGCTFVKCKYNEYGKKGVCQAKEIQIGGAVYQGLHEVKPICVNYRKGVDNDA